MTTATAPIPVGTRVAGHSAVTNDGVAGIVTIATAAGGLGWRYEIRNERTGETVLLELGSEYVLRHQPPAAEEAPCNCSNPYCQV